MEFRIKLKAAREAAGLTQGELGRRSGVGQRNISHWEAGRGVPRILDAEKMTDAMGITLDMLMNPPNQEAKDSQGGQGKQND